MNTSPDRIEQVTNLYFKAWAEQDSELLPQIFSADAVYRVKPFGVEEHVGLEAITAYWNDKVVSLQQDPKPMILEKAVGEDVCFVEWETSFTTHSQKEKTVRGILLLLFKDGLVSELREHFASEEA